jgi:fucose permease
MTRRDTLLVLLAYASFVLLGVASAIIGVLWSPHIMQSFNQSIGNLGWLLLSVTIGYVVASFAAGQLFTRFNVGRLLAGAMFAVAVGFAGYILAPGYEVMVLFGLLAGMGIGLLDGGMNIYFAAYYDTRLINWLHASFGVGSLLAPQIVNTVVLARGGDWRDAYLLLGIASVVVGAAYFLSAPHWQRLSDSASDAPAAPMSATLRLPLVWLGIIIFICYTGTEASAGTWAAPFFTMQGVDAFIANNWVTAYWLSFTIGRIVFGAFVTRLDTAWTIRGCLLGATAGALLVVWRPVPEANAIGIALYGFMLAPIFALLISATQDRLGPVHAPTAIGVQVAAAALGGGVFQALVGQLTERFGLEIVPVTFVVMSLAMLVVYQYSLSPSFDVTKAKRETAAAAAQD